MNQSKIHDEITSRMAELGRYLDEKRFDYAVMAALDIASWYDILGADDLENKKRPAARENFSTADDYLELAMNYATRDGNYEQAHMIALLLDHDLEPIYNKIKIRINQIGSVSDDDEHLQSLFNELAAETIYEY